jgi:uncharacterized protein YecE (DUF72 family)
MARIGCSGWSYEDWRGPVYPSSGSSARWLELYAEMFDTVELNATFYRLPQKTTVAHWARITPPGFCFAVKVSRYLTHVRRLRELRPGVATFVERLEPLAEARKLGPLLWQLPPTFARDDDRLADALEVLPPGRNAFEFRHESWFADDVYALLEAHGAALVVADRAPARPSPWIRTADWSFLRFHRGRARDGAYGRRSLVTWASLIRAADGDVFAYFNNDWQGFAVENARTLRRLV